MQRNFTFHKIYFLAAVLLFCIEVCIALFIEDRFIRPYFGDFLVVILLYCLLKSFWNAAPWKVGVAVLLFAFAVETGQHFHLVKRLGLDGSKVASTVIGTGFDWGDLLAYTLGIAGVLGWEYRKRERR